MVGLVAQLGEHGCFFSVKWDDFRCPPPYVWHLYVDHHIFIQSFCVPPSKSESSAAATLSPFGQTGIFCECVALVYYKSEHFRNKIFIQSLLSPLKVKIHVSNVIQVNSIDQDGIYIKATTLSPRLNISIPSRPQFFNSSRPTYRKHLLLT